MRSKVEALKSTLKVFLKSLPPSVHIRFDLCSFGSHYTFLFDDNSGVGKCGSRLYSQSTLNTALEHVENMNANYGGTEILTPIKEICGRVSERNAVHTKQLQAGDESEGEKVEWEAEILLLTDGEVWNSKPLFDLIRDQTQR